MYDTFYRLRGNGFRLTPDYRLSFAHPNYAAALDSIAGAQRQGEGFVVLTGPPGTGKTTLVDELIARLKPTAIPIAKVANTQVGAEELLRLLVFAFDISAEGASKATLLELLKHYLSERHVLGKSGLLIVDEAQDLDAPALEELRLITNFTIGSEPLVQVLLVGQDRLWDRLFCPELEQIHQRIIATCRLKPLTAAQTRRYLAHRLRWVGWAGDPRISGPAIARIHEFTCGIPRRINSVTGRLLQYGADAELHVLDASHAEEVLRQLSEDQLQPPTPLPDPLGLNGPSSTPPLRPLGALTAAAMKALEERSRKHSKASNQHQTPRPPVGPQGRGDPTRVLSTMPWRLARRIPAIARQKAPKAWFRGGKWLAWQGARNHANTAQTPSSTSQYLPRTVSLIPLQRTFKRWFKRVTPTLRRLHWRGAVVGGALVGLTLWAAVYALLGPTTLAQEQASPSFKSAAGRPAPEPRRLLPAAPREPSGHSQSITNTANKRSQTPSGSPTANARGNTQGFVKAENPTAAKPQPVKSDHESAGVSPIPPVDRSYPDHSSLPPLNAGPVPHRQPTAGGAQSIAETKGDFSAYEAQAPVTGVVNRVQEKPPAERLAKPAVGNDPKSEGDGTTAKTKDLPQRPDATELLAAAQRAMRDYRLTLPPGDNAHMHFRAVLAKDPSNTAARIGLWRIVRTYQELARRKIEVDDLVAADRLVRRGLKVIPNANALLAVARELEELAALNEIVEIEPAGRALSEAAGVRKSNEVGTY